MKQHDVHFGVYNNNNIHSPTPEEPIPQGAHTPAAGNAVPNQEAAPSTTPSSPPSPPQQPQVIVIVSPEPETQLDTPPAAFGTNSPPVGTDSPMAYAPKLCNTESKQPSLQDSKHRGKTAENKKLKLVPRHNRFKTQPGTKTQKQAVNNMTSKPSSTLPSPPPTTPTVAPTPAT